MPDKILVTGGCGFIGSHLVDRLLAEGHAVRILDNLDPQVHEGGPRYTPRDAELMVGDVADEEAVHRALVGIDVVFHFAAAVGVGQSMYQVGSYTRTNALGTARLLERIAQAGRGQLRKLIVASSMSVYGEGAYECFQCATPEPKRTEERMAGGLWEPTCGQCGTELTHRATDEEKPADPTSVYALNKLDQEKLCLIVGGAYSIPTVALRFFNVYGPRQSLSNPYTGVAAIFSSRIKAGRAPVIFEDGLQLRDFVSVHDIVSANLLALASDEASQRIFNVGSGRAVSVLDIAHTLLALYGESEAIQPEVTGAFRKGDIRHCYAEISAISELGYAPSVTLEEGLRELAEWADSVQSNDRFDAARRELESKGLA